MTSSYSRILLEYLRLTKGSGHASSERLAESALVSREVAEKVLSELGLDEAGGVEPRVKAALTALEMGVEGERVARYLEWREFEELAAEALEKAGYRVYRDLRVSAEWGRHQIDLAARKERLVLVVDCKHWKKPPSYWERRRIVEDQEKRLRALARLGGGGESILIPVVLTLYEPPERLVEGHPFVPIRMLRSFLEGLETHYLGLRHLRAPFSGERLKRHARSKKP